MKAFVFRGDWEYEIFSYLMEEHREAVKQFLDDAQQEAAEACTSGQFYLEDITPDHAVFERMGSRIRRFLQADCEACSGLRFGSLYWLILQSAVSDLDCNSIAAAIFYGVEPYSDPRMQSLRERDERRQP